MKHVWVVKSDGDLFSVFSTRDNAVRYVNKIAKTYNARVKLIVFDNMDWLEIYELSGCDEGGDWAENVTIERIEIDFESNHY